MSLPVIVARNPKVIQTKRLWNQARQDSIRRLYVVVRACPGEEGAWEGLPNLEMLEGGTARNGRGNSVRNVGDVGR